VNDHARQTHELAASPDAAQTVVIGGRCESAAALPERLTRDGYSVLRARDGWAVLDDVREHSVDLVVVDHLMPGLAAIEVCRLIKRDPRTRLVPVVVLLAVGVPAGDRVAAIEAGADDVVSPPVDAAEVLARIRALTRLKRYTDDFEMATSVMTTLATMIEARDRYSEGHCHRMANYAAALGRRIGLGGDDVHVLRRGAFLHDIGMLAVPDAVLLKPSQLDHDERELIRAHPVVGESLISNLRSLQPVRAIVRHHHERLDGSGYPDGLRGDDIPLMAQIVGLVEVFEALTSSRPYQKTHPAQDALGILAQHAEQGLYRPDLFYELGQVATAAGTICPT